MYVHYENIDIIALVLSSAYSQHTDIIATGELTFFTSVHIINVKYNTNVVSEYQNALISMKVW